MANSTAPKSGDGRDKPSIDDLFSGSSWEARLAAAREKRAQSLRASAPAENREPPENAAGTDATVVPLNRKAEARDEGRNGPTLERIFGTPNIADRIALAQERRKRVLGEKEPAAKRLLYPEAFKSLRGKEKDARAEEPVAPPRRERKPAAAPAATAVLPDLAPQEEPAFVPPPPRRRYRGLGLAIGLVALIGGGYLAARLIPVEADRPAPAATQTAAPAPLADPGPAVAVATPTALAAPAAEGVPVRLAFAVETPPVRLVPGLLPAPADPGHVRPAVGPSTTQPAIGADTRLARLTAGGRNATVLPPLTRPARPVLAAFPSAAPPDTVRGLVLPSPLPPYEALPARMRPEADLAQPAAPYLLTTRFPVVPAAETAAPSLPVAALRPVPAPRPRAVLASLADPVLLRRPPALPATTRVALPAGPPPLPAPDASAAFAPAPLQPPAVAAQPLRLAALEPGLLPAVGGPAVEPAAAPSFGNLLIYLNAPGSLSDAAVARIAEDLRATGLPVREPKRVGFTISSNNVRYYHAEDAEPARILAEALGGRARDFTDFRPVPPAGTIEIWLAGDSGGLVAPRATARARTAPAEDPAITALRNRLVQSLRQGFGAGNR